MGTLEIVTGCMFSGKTSEMLRRVTRVLLAKKKVLLFKPSIDTRYSSDEVVAHNGISLPCYTVPTLIRHEHIAAHGSADVIAFDEIQFLSKESMKVIRDLVASGKRVIASGLDLNFRAEPFGIMPDLLAMADEVLKLTAICPLCGQEATRTQRVFAGIPVTNGKEVVIGGEGTYEPRCKDCFRREAAVIL